MEIVGASRRATGFGIATARLYGITKDLYFFKHRGYYAFDIMFDNASTLGFYNLSANKAGDDYEEAENFWNEVKASFEFIGIDDGDKVAVIFKNNEVIAIGKIGQDLWIDTINGFTAKTFKELDFQINSLKVY